MEVGIVRVLLFDGDEERCTALAESLRGSDATSFRVVPVWTSLDDALEKLARHDFHVVLLDLDHPGSDGLEALVAVRDAQPSAAVVVLADRAVDEDVSQALKMGAYDYLLRDEIHPGVVIRVTRYAALRKVAEERERQAGVRYRQLFFHSMDAVVVTDPEGRPVDANPAALALVGMRMDELTACTLYDLLAEPAHGAQVRLALERRESVAGLEVVLRLRDGSERTCLLSAATHDQAPGGKPLHHAILRDITERKHAEEKLVHDALHDPLTGLPNRTLLTDRLEQVHARARRRPEHPYAVLFLDLDRFKRINDRLGHPTGDQVLAHAGRTIVEAVREADTVARVGGDEFAVLLDGSGLKEAHEVADRILEDLQRPFQIGGTTLSLTASIGIALPSERGFPPAALLREADTAMYRAKATGRARWQVYDPGMDRETQRALTLETELQSAVEGDGMQLFFHPIYDARGGALRGFEALVRWDHPEQGLLQPEAFIPFAEESGLVVDLGEWVIREACLNLVRWQEEFASQGFLSVNVSPKQFMQPDLVARIARILEETGAPVERLKLELTENALMMNAERTVQMLHDLRDLGLELWIDDFGTGYSSLAYLQRFPVSAVKIERTFVSRMKSDGGDEFVRMIISLARALDLATVAEGVETEEQLHRLREMGTSDLQGYLFSLPVPAGEVEALVRLGRLGPPGAWTRGVDASSAGLRRPQESN